MRRRKAIPRRDLKVIEGEGRRFRRLGEALVYYFILAVVAVLVIQAGYRWLEELILARRLQVVAAEPGFMENAVAVDGVITRREQVLYAPQSGVITEAVPGGERVAVNTPLTVLVAMSREDAASWQGEDPPGEENRWQRLVRWVGELLRFRSGDTGSDEERNEDEPLFTGEPPPWFREEVTVYADTAGLLSYHLDGWEHLDGDAFPPRELFAEEEFTPVTREEGTFIEAGEPLLKIVDNWRWRYHVVLPLDPGRAAAAHDTVTIVFAFAPENPVQALLEEAVVDTGAREVRLTYEIKTQLPGFEKHRRAEAFLNFQRWQGLLVPAEALLEREGETGLYINRGGRVVFAPVTVIRREADRALVEGIEPFTLVIGRPDLVREGRRFN